MGFRLETRSIAASAIFLITALQALDITVVNVAIPRLEAAMATSASTSAWIITAYILGTAILAPLTGWLRRRLGCRLLFQLAIAAFGLASLACAVAGTAPVMIGSRLLQGTAAGVLQPLSLAVLMDLYPAQQHGKVTANWMAVLMVGPAIGPLLGGTMTDLAGWPMIFLINAPIGLVALVALSVSLPAEEADDRRASDLVGLVLMTIAIGTLQLLLQQSQGPGGAAGPGLIVESVIAATALVAFLVHALRTPAPIVQIRALHDRNFLAAVLIMFVTCACLMGTIMLIPRLGEKSLGYSASAAGLLIVPRGVTTMVVSLWLARIVDRLDGRWIVAAGVIIVAMGMAMMALLPDGNPSPWLVAAATVQGAGTGMIFAPLTPLAFATMQPRQRTDAMGLISLWRILGSSMGGAAAIRLFVFELNGSAVIAGTPSALAAYRVDFLALCVATALSLLAVPLFRPVRRSPAPASQSAE